MQRPGIGEYPPGWKEFATQLKEEAGWICKRCGHPHDPPNGYTLTVHHLTMNKAEPFDHWWAFAVLCQRCHLTIQSKVVLDRAYYLPHSEWFKPFVGAFFAHKYLGVNLTREEVMADLDYWADLERFILEGDEIGA